MRRISVPMMKKYGVFILVVIAASGMVLCGAQTVKIADLEPGLRDAMVRDAKCQADSEAPAAGAPDAGRQALLQTTVGTKPLRGAGGHEVGVIVLPAGDCQCHSGNCSIYVYMKSEDGFRLVLKKEFASLHPMKSYKHGMPSLTGRHTVSSTVYETAIYDWDGENYRATQCARVTQGKNPKRPSIVKQECSNR